MTVIPVVLLVTAATALGAYLLLLWFQKTRRPVLIGFHLVLGFGSVESLLIFLRMGGVDGASQARVLALIAVGLFAAAGLSGFTAPLFGRSSRVTANSLLAAHVATGVAGFLIVLAFASQL